MKETVLDFFERYTEKLRTEDPEVKLMRGVGRLGMAAVGTVAAIATEGRVRKGFAIYSALQVVTAIPEIFQAHQTTVEQELNPVQSLARLIDIAGREAPAPY